MKYSEDFTVRSYEVDERKYLYPWTVMRYLQEAADHQMRDEDVEYSKLLFEKHIAFVVSRISIEIYGAPHKYSTIRSRSWTIPGHGANFPRGYDLYKGDELLAKALSSWALVDTENGKLIRYKDYDMSGYSSDAEPELEIPHRFKLPNPESFEKVAEQTVLPSWCDINHHINNTVYSRILYDMIPNVQDEIITSMNIYYKHEAKLGKDFVVYRSPRMSAEGLDPRADEVICFYTESEGKTNVQAVFGLKKPKK